MRLPRISGPLPFALGALALGSSAVAVALPLAPGRDLSRASPGVALAPWLFVAVWTLIYPCLGVATWRIYLRRHDPEARSALVVFGLLAVLLWTFLPLVAAAHEQRVTAILDVVATIHAFVAAHQFARVDRTAAHWMLPLLCWLPVTTLLKWVTL
jgi:tryptophan-rich sensory protein